MASSTRGTSSRSRIGLALALSVPALLATAGMRARPETVLAQRQDILDGMLTEEFTAYDIANLRRKCASGKVPADITEGRRLGAAFEPDAGDQCVTALVRTARDGHLADFYRELLTGMGGRAEDAGRWPGLAGAKLLAGSAQVPIGNGKAATVTAAVAFDTGFTVAYLEAAANKAVKADAAQLKTVAEACLAQRQDAGTCYAIGYVYGGQARQGWTAVAR